MGPARLAGGHWRERPRADKTNLSIATGGTGGVYYPLGGGMAAVLSKYVPGMQATAEVTSCSVDNLKLIGSGNGYIALAMADALARRAQGQKDRCLLLGGRTAHRRRHRTGRYAGAQDQAGRPCRCGAAMNKKYGNLYVQDVIPNSTYGGMQTDNRNATVWSIWSPMPR